MVYHARQGPEIDWPLLLKGVRMRFEHRSQPLLSRAEFIRRIVRYAGFAFAVVAGALVVGVFGYRGFEGLSWTDSLLNAAMILGGMGPVNILEHQGAKIFASIYALLSGFVFLVAVGVLLAPVIHRFFHHFHLEAGESS
jgi:hypothetical protein